jgi:hypothetical protein
LDRIRDYTNWIAYHRQVRRGERLRRLLEGHGHAEQLFMKQVWIPGIGDLHHLHPEYEIYDYRDGSRFLDFAFIKPPFRLCIEIDGYGPHWRDMDRRQFADHLTRQNHLVVDGWRVLRFAYDDVHDKPRKCQQIIQQLLGRQLGYVSNGSVPPLTIRQKELLRHAASRREPLTLIDAAHLLQTGKATARKELRELVEKRLLAPVGGQQRVHAYRMFAGDFDFSF